MGRTPSKKSLKKKADDAMSLYIRERDRLMFGPMCRICGIRPIEVNYHIWPRNNMGTRYHALACVASCRGCNFNEFIDRRSANKERLKAIYIKILGQDLYDELDALSHKSVQISAVELIEIAHKYEKMYNELKEKQ